MGWHLMEKLIEQSAEQSTMIGKLWVTSVFILRLLIATSISDDVWDDSQEEFVCNTLSPGCSNVCFNEYSPISLTRYWMLQILFTALPSMIFIVYTAHKLHKLEIVLENRKNVEKSVKELDKKKSSEAGQASVRTGGNDGDDDDDDDDDDDKPVATKLSQDTPSMLFVVYYLAVLIRTILEIAFMVGQYFIYTFKFMMPELFVCQHWPCPNAVDCFVSRPKEKSVMICVFYATGIIMVMLNLMELWHITAKFPSAWRDRGDDITKHADQGRMFHFDEDTQPYVPYAPGVDYYEEELDGYPNATSLPALRPVHDRRHQGGIRTHRRYRR